MAALPGRICRVALTARNSSSHSWCGTSASSAPLPPLLLLLLELMSAGLYAFAASSSGLQGQVQRERHALVSFCVGTHRPTTA